MIFDILCVLVIYKEIGQHLFFCCFLSIVLPPVLVPRQSEYPKIPPPLPSPFRSAEEPPMPYNACFPFKQQPQQLDKSPNIYVPGKRVAVKRSVEEGGLGYGALEVLSVLNRCLDQVSVARNDWESWILTGLSLSFKLPVP